MVWFIPASALHNGDVSRKTTRVLIGQLKSLNFTSLPGDRQKIMNKDQADISIKAIRERSPRSRVISARTPSAFYSPPRKLNGNSLPPNVGYTSVNRRAQANRRLFVPRVISTEWATGK